MTENTMNNLLVKKFQDNDIVIYGTHEKPLFKAKDIGNLLGIIKITKTLENLDSEFKLKINAPSGGVGNSDQWFLTIDGLYEVLFISRKPIAKEFRTWVRSILEEIRLTGEYKNSKINQEIGKSNQIIEQFHNQPVVYLGLVEEIDQENQIVKYGYTGDIKKTSIRHKKSYG